MKISTFRNEFYRYEYAAAHNELLKQFTSYEFYMKSLWAFHNDYSLRIHN